MQADLYPYLCSSFIGERMLSPLFIFLFSVSSILSFAELYARKPVRTVVDLNLGESKRVELTNGEAVTVKLLEMDNTADNLRSAIRAARVKVDIDGETLTLCSGNYNLPVAAGKAQVDCPITRDYYRNSNVDRWGLEHDARLRLWPAGSPFIAPGTFVYPVRQRWFSNDTQMSNEPCYVDGGEDPERKEIYYHYGLDIGGSEGLDEVLAATDGLVASIGVEGANINCINIIDERGWHYHYTHLKSIDPEVQPGTTVKKGQRIGILGKEGTSGGWSHLHFEINYLLPSGKWAIEEGYAYLWQSYAEQYKPDLIAVARPHQLAEVGETVTLDGRKSRSFKGEIKEYEWIFTDGSGASGPVQKRAYQTPGTYAEMLKVVDSQSNIDYDCAVVQVIDKNEPDKLPPAIHANFYPTFGIKPGDPVTFKVRSFNALAGNETWDFGDGSPKVTVKSTAGYSWYYERIAGKMPEDSDISHSPTGYAKTVHSFSKPGHYLVRVERTGDFGYKAVARLHVYVSKPAEK
ncbi:MAG TPA: PKD domain-containing protein [archaeon]|nr:PKD domain-containing protein [archaeon]